MPWRAVNVVLPGESRLFADLRSLEIAYHLVEHQAVFTVQESSALERGIAGAHTKNLFLKDAGGAFWLVTVPAEMRVNLKTLPSVIGCKRVSFGKADSMADLLGIMPGSVTPLAVINDIAGKVTVVLHSDLLDAETVNVHPLRNTATIGLKPSDLLRLLHFWQHVPVVGNIPNTA